MGNFLRNISSPRGRAFEPLNTEPAFLPDMSLPWGSGRAGLARRRSQRSEPGCQVVCPLGRSRVYSTRARSEVEPPP
jgi:hypothetical protein